MVLTLLGLAATALASFSLVPQVHRGFATRVVDGVSWDSTVLNVVSSVLWLAYGVASGHGIQVVSNLTASLLNLALLLALFRAAAGRPLVRTAVLIGGTALGVGLATSAVAPVVLAGVGGALGVVRLVPQVRLAWSGRPLWGLDPWSVQLAVYGAVLWTAYGVLVGDTAVTVTSALCAALSAAVCLRRLPPRRTLTSLAHGRLGEHVATPALVVCDRFGIPTTSDERLPTAA